MNDWLVIGIIVAAAVLIIGNFSTFEKSAKTPLRKKGLNDLEETLPRSHKSQHTLKATRYNSPDQTNSKSNANED